MVKVVKGPVPQSKIIPIGGVSLDNVKNCFKADVFAVGVGSDIKKGIGIMT